MNTLSRLIRRFFPNPYGVTLTIQQRIVFEVMLGCLLIIGKRLLAKNNIAGRYIEIGTQALFAMYMYFVLHLFISSVAQISFAALAIYGLIKRSTAITEVTIWEYSIIFSTVALCIFITRRYICHQRPRRRSQLVANCCGLGAYLCLAHHLPVGRLLLAAGHSTLAYVYQRKNAYIFVVIQLISAGVALSGYFA